MAFGALAALRAGAGAAGRRKRRIRTGPKRGKPSRKLTTSQLAIRRSEARRRRGSSGPDRGPRRVKGNPTRGVPTRGRTTRTINTGSSRRSRSRSPLATILRRKQRMQKGRCK